MNTSNQYQMYHPVTLAQMSLLRSDTFLFFYLNVIYFILFFKLTTLRKINCTIIYKFCRELKTFMYDYFADYFVFLHAGQRMPRVRPKKERKAADRRAA